MRKTDKKLEKQIVTLLTDVCETHLKGIDGFCWLTHLVDYQRFPSSLNVVLIFSDSVRLNQFLSSPHGPRVLALIKAQFAAENILFNPHKQLSFDLEVNWH
ncbi:hypothetical protein [Gayadomonas joobiniege]|uniref:hypothetical protein n=1 Tax=Gayadomonas joobiniege TaxID=1234606 RepID=UPI000368DF2C|nr:hypothetical protein [Gayadomonas joobiniege]